MASQSYTFTDLSVPSTTNPTSTPTSSVPLPSSNPYTVLIRSCSNTPSQITSRYSTHRNTRFSQQKTQLLSPSFAGTSLDTTLLAVLKDPSADTRHNLPVWIRPPSRVRELVARIQTRLAKALPQDTMWMMPPDCLHMTVLEFAHSRTQGEIEGIVDKLQAKGVVERLTEFPRRAAEGEDGKKKRRTAKLEKPMLCFDGAAAALSYLPPVEDEWGYHHLREELWEVGSQAVEVASRYVVPSAHLTVGRFVEVIQDMRGFVEAVEEVNAWLEQEIWGDAKQGGVWTVGEEKGLDLRKGACWYGGGESVRVGEGIREIY